MGLGVLLDILPGVFECGEEFFFRKAKARCLDGEAVEPIADLTEPEIKRESFGVGDLRPSSGEDHEGSFVHEMLDHFVGGVWVNADGLGQGAHGGEFVIGLQRTRRERTVHCLDDLLISRTARANVDLERKVAHAERCLSIAVLGVLVQIGHLDDLSKVFFSEGTHKASPMLTEKVLETLEVTMICAFAEWRILMAKKSHRIAVAFLEFRNDTFFVPMEDQFINRELSWLEFNQRVLNEAQRPDLPILERLKFLAITDSNLDEFFQVRLGGLYAIHQNAPGFEDRHGERVSDQVTSIEMRARRMMKDQAKLMKKKLLPLLKEHGITRRKMKHLSEIETAEARDFFTASVAPLLTPMVIDEEHALEFVPR